VTITRTTIAALAYTILTVAITYPLALHLSTRVPHDLGDPLLSTVVLWWSAHHLPLTADWWNAPFFWPAGGALTFSDHRLGETLLASPLQWMGFSPLASYNITLLATFPACALAAHWLAYTLTKRHDAAAIAGLAYGFNPYRFGHMEHLELLAAFGMPVALVSLHRFFDDRRIRWIVLFAVSLVVQALACSYYFLFFLVLLGLWIVWFVRRDQLRLVVWIAVAGLLVVAAISPIAIRYVSVHKAFGLKRLFSEVVILSADVTSLVTAPALSLLWGWTSSLNETERQLFPGATISLLVLTGMTAAILRNRAGPRQNKTSATLAVMAVLPGLIAASAVWLGPWRIGPVSVGTAFKPFSVAVLLVVAAVLASSWTRGAFRRRSAFAFYVLAAATLFLFSFGPKPAFLQHQILYQAPYAWLTRLELFDENVRVPARFAMLAILCLSMAAALAYVRLAPRRSPWRLGAALAVAILADSWITELPLLEPPQAWPASVSAANFNSFVELPLGETIHDASAMYRAMLTGRPTANGYSGYFPPHYEALRLGMEERDETSLNVLASRGPLLVVVERAWPYSAERLQWLRSNPAARTIAENSEYVWFIVEGRPANAPVCSSTTLPIARLNDAKGAVALDILEDGDDDTFWTSGQSQRAGDSLVIDLGQVARPCSVQLTLGSHVGSYPRVLRVETSLDGNQWVTSFTGKTGGLALASALTLLRQSRVDLPLGSAPARFVRLRLEADERAALWLITELAVTASPPE
jgi:hypothetical protein